MCKKCVASDHDVHLHVEIENLKQKLVERENHIVTMETNFLNEANKFPSGELVALREELLTWQDKYKRLYDAHRRVQRVNQGLEDKLLKLVDVCETEKTTLTKDVAVLSQKLAEANYAVKKLTEDNERYKNDVSLAIQFLQCKQSNFVAHKFDSLPQEVQVQVSSHMTNKRKPEEKKVSYEMKSIKVPIPTFPPTAMVYSVPKSPKPDRKVESEVESPAVDIVSAAIMAKVLEERQKEKAFAKHCDTCTCSKKLNIVCEISHYTVGTQTGDYKNVLCLRCNENLPQSPQRMKLVKQEPPKKVPIYPNESTDTAQTNGNNIVKVQPNNFLTDETPHVESNSPLVTQPNNNLSNPEVKSQPDINFFSINEAPRVKNAKSPKLGVKVEHHRLCTKTSPTYEVENNKDKSESDETSAKNGSSENLKGPRYCSMRVQTGTRNILLDNAHNNVAPVLYKRHHKIKHEETPTTHEASRTESCSSEDLKNISIISDNSTHNRQRVADWIQNSNLENENSSSENSQSEPLIGGKKSNLPGVDKIKYAEMEEHVKRFLFGESEFLKTVEIGKLKYQNYRENEGDRTETNSSRSNSHTETEI
jgi:tight junction protein 4 (peripheral)